MHQNAVSRKRHSRLKNISNIEGQSGYGWGEIHIHYTLLKFLIIYS